MVSVELVWPIVLLVLTVRVAVPGAFTELELSVAVAPDGAPLTLSATAPLKPFNAPTFTVEVALLPAVIVMEAGDADTVKSGGCCTGLTVNDTAAVCNRAPLVPVMVSVEVLWPMELPVLMVIVVVPEPVTVGGVKLGVAPLGKPLTLGVTVPLNPLLGVTVTV
jgi:hypothetical protein